MGARAAPISLALRIAFPSRERRAGEREDAPRIARTVRIVPASDVPLAGNLGATAGERVRRRISTGVPRILPRADRVYDVYISLSFRVSVYIGMGRWKFRRAYTCNALAKSHEREREKIRGIQFAIGRTLIHLVREIHRDVRGIPPRRFRSQVVCTELRTPTYARRQGDQ